MGVEAENPKKEEMKPFMLMTFHGETSLWG